VVRGRCVCMCHYFPEAGRCTRDALLTTHLILLRRCGKHDIG
jgi:hypothetical protein